MVSDGQHSVLTNEKRRALSGINAVRFQRRWHTFSNRGWPKYPDLCERKKLVALADVDSKQWEPLLDLIASLPPDLAADRPSWLGAAAPRLTRKVTFASLTRAQRADVARLYATGVPVRDICARFNITKNTVIRLRKQAGVPQLQRGRDEPQGHEAEAMYASSTSPMAIACGDSPPGRLRAARSSRRTATSAKRARPPRMSLPPIKPA